MCGCISKPRGVESLTKRKQILPGQSFAVLFYLHWWELKFIIGPEHRRYTHDLFAVPVSLLESWVEVIDEFKEPDKKEGGKQ